jgi:hypothetical protein
VELAEDTFEIDGGDIHLSIPKTRLATGKGPATKQIAQLVAAARQAAEIEDSTSNEVIREEVEAYGRLDSPNFARDLKQLDEFFTFPGGGGRDWRVRVRRSSFVEAGELVSELNS